MPPSQFFFSLLKSHVRNCPAVLIFLFSFPSQFSTNNVLIQSSKSLCHQICDPLIDIDCFLSSLLIYTIKPTKSWYTTEPDSNPTRSSVFTTPTQKTTATAIAIDSWAEVNSSGETFKNTIPPQAESQLLPELTSSLALYRLQHTVMVLWNHRFSQHKTCHCGYTMLGASWRFAAAEAAKFVLQGRRGGNSNGTLPASLVC